MMKCYAALLSALTCFMVLPKVQGQLYWDINGASPGAASGDASGTWNSTSMTWNQVADGTGTIQAWDSVNTPVAVFSAGGADQYTVTITDTETANGLILQDGPIGMTLAASGSGQLILNGPATVSAPSATAEQIISAPIGGTAGLNASGANVLILSGANTYTGTTTIGAGLKLKLGATNAVPSGSVLALTGGNVNTAFDMNGFDDTVKSLTNVTGSGTPAANILIGSRTLTLADPQDEITGAIFNSSAGGKVVKKGTGSITLNGATALFTGGEFVVDEGNVTIGANNCFGSLATGSKLTMNGGSLTALVNMSMNTKNMDIGGSFAMNMNTNGNLQFFGNGDGAMVLKASNPTITVNIDKQGDYNGNNVVDAADYVMWRELLGTNDPLPNEVSGITTGKATQEDYDAWRARLGNTTRKVIPDPIAPTAINGVFILGGILQDDPLTPGTPRGFTKVGRGNSHHFQPEQLVYGRDNRPARNFATFQAHWGGRREW